MGYDVVAVIPDYRDVFLGACQVEDGLPHEDRIDRQLLDFSPESLRAVDRYLEYLYERADEISEQQYTNVVLAAGAYLGEVVRRSAAVRFKWMNYEEYFPQRPEMARMVPETLGTAAVLVTEGGSMTMPLNKIVRFLDEGPNNSTHYYAIGEIERRPR